MPMEISENYPEIATHSILITTNYIQMGAAVIFPIHPTVDLISFDPID